MAAKECGIGCELCGGVAAVHCPADSAFLCLSCDAKVHGANFLASRHRRRRLGAGGDDDDDARSGSSASGSCVSTADSSVAAAAGRGRGGPRRRPRAEAVLEGWAKRMGFGPAVASRRAAAAAGALRALGRGVAAARVPLRVAMAAALWSEVAAAGRRGADAALLRGLEASAHVPARLVLTVASWMARAGAGAGAARLRRDAEEGWAECA